MAEYQRSAQRFFYNGISTLPPDALPPGKLPFGRNIRSYQEGVITPREGISRVLEGSLDFPIHSLARLNDGTPFNGGRSALRVFGLSTFLGREDPDSTFEGVFDSDYSGNPLTFMSAQPPQAPRPYLYVADSNKQRKLTTDSDAMFWGIAPPSSPLTEPFAALQALKTRYIFGGLNDLGTTWTAAGVAAAAPVIADRINTVIGSIAYDDTFVNTGYCSIAPSVLSNITTGAVVTIGGERTIITEIMIAVAETTVEAVIYDSGSTGFCTIQPSGSLGTGQLDAPSWAESNRVRQIDSGTRYAVPRGSAGVNPLPPSDGPRKRIRQVDFPVNCLIQFGGGEVTRIASVSMGADGQLSFRCETVGTVTPGMTITGIGGIRCYLNSTHVPGEAIQDQTATSTLQWPTLPVGTPAGTLSKVTGGLQSALAINFAQFSDNTAILPEDEIHLAVKIDQMTTVTSIRVYFDCDVEAAADTAFLKNYFFFEWRASDIATAIQATNAAEVTPLVEARTTVVTNAQLDAQIAAIRADFIENRVQYIQQYGSVLGAQRAMQEQINALSASVSNRSRRINTGAAATSDRAVTQELALGNSQWLDLRLKVSDLIRVGTDTSRTLANIGAVEMLISAEQVGVDSNENPLALVPISFELGDVFCAGGAGPDVGETGDPYKYRYRYRSSETGGLSNPSPELRGGVIPKRQSVLLYPVASDDPQVDKIDWFRMGSTLTTYQYVGTQENSGAPFEDTLPDGGVDGGETLAFDNFQPWPTQDLPTVGECDVAGTAVVRTSGPEFNTAWAAGSPLTINGRVCTLWASPASGDLLHVNENLKSGSGVPFEVNAATKMGQPLRACWGDYLGLWFACGDPDNPGTLYWTHGNNPECARDIDTLLATPPSEPLQGGGIFNTFPFVFSNEDFYQILVSGGATAGGRVRVVKTPCGRGVWTPWSFDVGPEGIWFLAEDGVYLTAGGAPAVSITDPDLRTLFPHDGITGSSINGIVPPNMASTNDLRISYISGFVYFDYLGQDDRYHSLIFEVAKQRWFYDDVATTDILVRLEEPGAGVYDQIMGGRDGQLYIYDRNDTDDAGVDINWDVWTNLFDAGQPRQTKQFGDVGISLDAMGSIEGISVRVITNDATLQTAETFGAGDTGRQTYILDIASGNGIIARNLGLRISGVVTEEDTARPQLFLWEPTFIPKGDDFERRATDWDNLGYMGTKFVQGVIINANTFGAEKTIQIQRDAAEGMIDLTINHDGEVTLEYPRATQAEPGWPPFLAQMVRIVGQDDVDWQLLGYRFVYEPHPELATQWETQFTSHDLKGYMSVRDAVIAYCAEGEVRLRVIYDGGETYDYTLPATGGTEMEDYDRWYQVLAGRKGLAVQYQLRSGCPFRLFKRDCSVRVYDWGSGNTYLQAIPFGGPHRADGAAI